MEPTSKVYTFEMSKNDDLADSFRLKTYSEHPDRVRFCAYGSSEDGSLTLCWMEKDELVAWLRKAADLLEKASLD